LRRDAAQPVLDQALIHLKNSLRTRDGGCSPVSKGSHIRNRISQLRILFPIARTQFPHLCNLIPRKRMCGSQGDNRIPDIDTAIPPNDNRFPHNDKAAGAKIPDMAGAVPDLTPMMPDILGSELALTD
jgi:hypothetical protein